MITKEINELTSVTTLTTADYVEIDNGNSLKATVGDILNLEPSRISALSSITSISSTDCVEIISSSLDYKASFSTIMQQVTTTLGTYTKLADGTLIQAYTDVTTRYPSATAGSIYYCTSFTIYFPIEYKAGSNPIVIPQANKTAGLTIGATAYSVTPSCFTCYIMAYNQSSAGVLQYISYGPWK